MLTVAERRKRRMDVLPLAVLVQMTANINRDSQQRLQPFEIEEVLGWLGIPAEEMAPPSPPPSRPSPDELREKLALLAQMYPKPNGQCEGG